MERVADPMETILPGEWRLTFEDHPQNITGAGVYTFKLAGTFDADVRDIYSGHARWHGYWEIIDAQLVLNANEVDATCSSCVGAAAAHNWTIKLEQVNDHQFSGVLSSGDDEPQRVVYFVRVS